MKRVIAAILALIFIIPLASIGSYSEFENGRSYQSNNDYYSYKNRRSPVIDGVLDSGEWYGSAAYEIDGDQLSYYSANSAFTEFTLVDKTTINTIGDSRIYISWDDDNLYVAGEIADTTVSKLARAHTWYPTGSSNYANLESGYYGDSVTLCLRTDGNPISQYQDPGPEGGNNMAALTLFPFPGVNKTDGNREGTWPPVMVEMFNSKLTLDMDQIEAMALNNIDDGGYTFEYAIPLEYIGSLYRVGFAPTQENETRFTSIEQVKEGGELYFSVLLSDGMDTGYATYYVTTGTEFKHPTRFSYIAGMQAGETIYASDKGIHDFEPVLGCFGAETKKLQFKEPKDSTITFDLNGGRVLGEYSGIDSIASEEVKAGEEFSIETIYDKYTFFKPGKKLVGFFMAGREEAVTEFTPDGDVTLTAHWADLTYDPVGYEAYTKNADAPTTLDGVINPNEWKDAIVIDVKAEDQLYYGNSSDEVRYLIAGKEAIEARGSKMIGDSKIYVLPTEDGVYFAFDVKDTTYGANYVRSNMDKFNTNDTSAFRGESVGVIFSSDNSGAGVEKMNNNDAIRFMVCPFTDDSRSAQNSIRNVKITSGVLRNGAFGSYSGEDRTGYLSEGASWDETGYTVEFMVPWSELYLSGFNGTTSYLEGSKLYLNFEIVDAMGRSDAERFAYAGGYDYGVFTVPVNSTFRVSGTNADGSFCVEDGVSWISFAEGSATEILLTKKAYQDSANDYSSENATYIYPKCDGKISTGEYRGALITDINTNDQKYYGYQSSVGSFLAFDSSQIEARGNGESSHMIGSSKIYMLPTDEGLYFAFDIADSTIGSNSIKDVTYRGGMFNGDAVHVILRQDNDNCTNEKLNSGEAVRFSIAPFVNNNPATDGNIRKIKIKSAITYDAITEIDGERHIPYVLETTGMLSEACKADENGYALEFCIPWSVLKSCTSFEPNSYKNGSQMFINYMITDAMGINSGFTDGWDWAVFQCPVNSEFVVTQSGLESDNNGADNGILIDGGTNYSSFAAGTATRVRFDYDENAKYNYLYFETNCDDTIEPLKIVNGSNIDLSEYVPKKNGYTFVGWFNDSDFLDGPITDELIITKDTTIYAKWIEGEYEIGYLSNGTYFMFDYDTKTLFFYGKGTIIRIGGEEDVVEAVNYDLGVYEDTIVGSWYDKYRNITEHIVIDDSIVEIGEFAFYDFKNLKSVSLPNGLKSIGGESFKGCEKLEKVILPNELTVISWYAFEGCTSLKEVDFNDKLTTIDYGAFYGCESLEDAILPDSLEYLREEAFAGCKAMYSASISNNTAIESNVFNGCDSLCLINYRGTMSEWLTGVSGTSNDYCMSILSSDTFVKCEDSTDSEAKFKCTINNNYAELTGYRGQTPSLLDLPDSIWGYEVNSIGNKAFYNCPYLEEVVIPQTVKTINNYAFDGCNNILSIFIPDSVTEIYPDSFSANTIIEANCNSYAGSYYKFYSKFTAIHSLVEHEGKEETCAEDGWNSYVTCNNCEYTTFAIIPKGHKLVSHEAKEPTCLNPGWNAYETCSRCDYSTFVEIAPTGHITNEWTGDTISHWHICSQCGDKVDIEEHSSSSWIVDLEPTVNSKGSRHKECTVCGRVLETEEIPYTHIPGDVNGDGAVNNKDLTRLLRYLSDWEVEVNEAALDINGDGFVNNKDFTRLFRYLSDWDVIIN